MDGWEDTQTFLKKTNTGISRLDEKDLLFHFLDNVLISLAKKYDIWKLELERVNSIQYPQKFLILKAEVVCEESQYKYKNWQISIDRSNTNSPVNLYAQWLYEYFNLREAKSRQDVLIDYTPLHTSQICKLFPILFPQTESEFDANIGKFIDFAKKYVYGNEGRTAFLTHQLRNYEVLAGKNPKTSVSESATEAEKLKEVERAKNDKDFLSIALFMDIMKTVFPHHFENEYAKTN